MAKDKNNTNNKSLLQKLRYKYRLIILNEDTFEQKASMRLSRMNLYVLSSVLLLLVVVIVTAIIAFTPLKYYMPGIGSIDVRTQLIEVEMLTDSLEKEIDRSNLWMSNLQKVLNGDLDTTYLNADSIQESDLTQYDLEAVSEEEEAFRNQIEDEMENEELYAELPAVSSTEQLLVRFSAPSDGTVISFFDAKKGHYGIDIAGEENEAVFAVESGTVIVADWNIDNGHVIAIQHLDNSVSFYKHNALLLKKVGSFVKKGEVIAQMGDSGRLSDGPHLHFELWKSGKALNPLNYFTMNKISE